MLNTSIKNRIEFNTSPVTDFQKIIRKTRSLKVSDNIEEFSSILLEIEAILPLITASQEKEFSSKFSESTTQYIKEGKYFETKYLQIRHQFNQKGAPALIHFLLLRFADKLEQHLHNIKDISSYSVIHD